MIDKTKVQKALEAKLKKKEANARYYAKNKEEVLKRNREKHRAKVMDIKGFVRQRPQSDEERKSNRMAATKKWKGNLKESRIFTTPEIDIVFRKYCKMKKIRVTRIIDEIYIENFNSNDFVKYLNENGF